MFHSIFVGASDWNLKRTGLHCSSPVFKAVTCPARDNSVSPWVSCHPGRHNIVGWPLRGGKSTTNTEKPYRYKGQKSIISTNLQLFNGSHQCHDDCCKNKKKPQTVSLAR
jgi:hypothetical protein